MTTIKKTIAVNLKLDAEIKDAAQRAAAEDRRTFTSLVEKLLRDYCREHGFLPPAPSPIGRNDDDLEQATVAEPTRSTRKRAS